MFYDTSVQPYTETAPQKRPNLLTFLRACLAINPPLTLFGIAMILTLIGTLTGLAFDHRVITGMPAWVKPAKFALSLGIYGFTLLWLLTFIRGHKRLISLASSGIALAGLMEIIVIVTQVIRGTTSHFNFSSSLNGTLYEIMGISIMVLVVLNLLVAILLLFQPMPDAAFAWSLRLGLLLCIAGMCEAVLMLSPTLMFAHLVAPHAGKHLLVIGAHGVGVLDGGPGLPFLGWSTTGGDLRIAHFVGLHALQVMPLLGWLISRCFRTLGGGRRVALVWTAGLGYLGLIGLLTWQALRAQPLLAPDTLTLQALALLLGGVALAVILIVAPSPRKR